MKLSEDLLNKILDKLVASTKSPKGRFSATATYPILQHRLFGRHLFSIQKALATAAIALILISSWWGYQYYDSTRFLSVSTLSEIRHIALSDGSRITLNRYSTITYPKHFDRQREIQLEGEAYFAVRHDNRHPFIVKAANIEVQDLGTHFNIEAYQKSPQIKTTLIEGRVSVKSSEARRTIPIELKPGESIIWDKDNKVFSRSKELSTANTIAWRDGSFIFDHCTISEVAERLSNTFDTPILLQDKSLGKYRINARFCHKEDLRTILSILQQAGYFKYRISNKKIILSIN